MRQGQQNRRGRGRNRKGQNPLTRSYESNGPDVKIRGTPAHVAEKYMSLARDAMASGDRVLAENYFQHAEHYNRIIMAYRDQQLGGPQDGTNGRSRQGGGMDDGDGADDFDDEGDLAASDYANGHGDIQSIARGMEDQPMVGQPSGGGQERGQDRGQERGQDRERRNGARQRRGRGSRNPGERGARGSDSSSARLDGGEGDGGGRQAPAPRSAERFADSDDRPEFLRRSVRRPQAVENGASGGEADHDTSVVTED
jgi:hypothetical protein